MMTTATVCFILKTDSDRYILKKFKKCTQPRVRARVSGSRVAGLNHYAMIVLALAVVFNFLLFRYSVVNLYSKIKQN